MKSFSIALMTVVISSAAVAGPKAPGMSIRSSQIELAQDECMTKAANAVRKDGMTENFESLGKTVYGEKGDYTAAIRCEVDNKIAIFIVSGPDDKITSEYSGQILSAFKN
jgi:hypothetical protein